jgi:hypothetical protein
MKAIAILVRTVNIMNYPFAASLPEGNFLVKNFEENLTEDDYGRQILVEYDPQDQFCTFKAFYAKEDTLERLFHSGKIEETVQQLITEAVKVSDSCLDEAVHDVYSCKASEINNGGKEAQIRFLVQEHGVHAIPMIRELIKEEQ